MTWNFIEPIALVVPSPAGDAPEPLRPSLESKRARLEMLRLRDELIRDALDRAKKLVASEAAH